MVEHEPEVDISETEGAYWSPQQLTITMALSLVAVFALPWCRIPSWGRRRFLARTNPYRPLNVENNEIRLLKILPGVDGDDLASCTIRHASFSENPVYAALSYSWGDQNTRWLIRVDGVMVNVIVSLEEALRYMALRGNC